MKENPNENQENQMSKDEWRQSAATASGTPIVHFINNFGESRFVEDTIEIILSD